MDASGFACTGAALSVSGAQQELAQNTRAQLECTTKLTDVVYALRSMIITALHFCGCRKKNVLYNFWTRVCTMMSMREIILGRPVQYHGAHSIQV
jgi:hypothetical protein